MKAADRFQRIKILLFTKNWLGDVIFESPALKAIKKNYPNAHLVCVSPARCQEILKKNPYVDEVIPFNERAEDRSLARKIEFVKRLRREKYDMAILCHRSFTRALLVFLGGVRERIGYAAKGRSWLLTRSVADRGEKIHHVHYFLNLLREAGFRVEVDEHYEFYFSQADDRRASILLSDKGLNLSELVAINPGANRHNKRWPTTHFARLVDLLYEKYHLSFVITGHLQDDVMASDTVHQVRKTKLVSLCGNTSLGELGAIFSRCRLVISGDSGPLHIAAGVGANVLALFGPTNPRLTGPLGRGRNVIIEASGQNGRSMSGIQPERVLEVIATEKLI